MTLYIYRQDDKQQAMAPGQVQGQSELFMDPMLEWFVALFHGQLACSTSVRTKSELGEITEAAQAMLFEIFSSCWSWQVSEETETLEAKLNHDERIDHVLVDPRVTSR